MEKTINKRKKAAPKGKATTSTTPQPAEGAFPCETCGKPHTCASDNVAYCDDCAPPVRLGEELFHALFSPKLRGLRPGHWSVCLTSVWGESETGVLDLYEKRVGRDLSVDEARACIDTARSVAESLHRVCDVASAVLDHGAETVRTVTGDESRAPEAPARAARTRVRPRVAPGADPPSRAVVGTPRVGGAPPPR